MYLQCSVVDIHHICAIVSIRFMARKIPIEDLRRTSSLLFPALFSTRSSGKVKQSETDFVSFAFDTIPNLSSGKILITEKGPVTHSVKGFPGGPKNESEKRDQVEAYYRILRPLHHSTIEKF